MKLSYFFESAKTLNSPAVIRAVCYTEFEPGNSLKFPWSCQESVFIIIHNYYFSDSTSKTSVYELPMRFGTFLVLACVKSLSHRTSCVNNHYSLKIAMSDIGVPVKLFRNGEVCTKPFYNIWSQEQNRICINILRCYGITLTLFLTCFFL